MHDPLIRNPAYRALTDQQLSEIDELCDRFDQELLQDHAPRMETFLEEAPEAARGGLLAELLAMEVEYRAQQGDVPQQEEYLQRFPQQERVVADLFARDAQTQISGNVETSRSVEIPPELDNFRLLEQIGRGGMGVVWLAEQLQPVRRRVALKLIKADLDSKDVLARFDAEKQALAMMDHPNIARVLNAGTTNDRRPYFVMELVDGLPITQYCDDHKLSVDERLKLFVPVCKAVQHAHQKGIVHRDLKPSNVLVTVIDGEAVPKVIDFGLAKAVEQNLRLTDATMQTEFGKIVGTVQYMSPEQAELKDANAQDIDTRTDVYSLGVMLYELLTGSTPLDKETLGRNALLKILELIREEDPPRPSSRLSSSSHEVNSAVSDLRRLHPARLQQLLRGELDWVVMKALEKDRARRYQTANDLSQDLSNYLTGETVSARPPSSWYQLQKFARRNRGLVAAMLAIGVALIAGISGTGYGLYRANEKTKLAEEKTTEAIEERGKAVASEQKALVEKTKAESNERRAAEAEERATAESMKARDSEASAKFQLANARWDAQRAGDARELLYQIPVEYRDNFEWHFCSRRFEGSDITCYGHRGDVYDVALTPDGTRVISAGNDGEIKLWDATSGEEVRTFQGHQGSVLDVAVNADGSRLISAGADKTVRLWDIQTGEAIRTMNGHTGSVRGVAFRPGADRIVSGSYDGTVKLWNSETGELVTSMSGHQAGVLGVAVSPDGRTIASVSGDRRIFIWDARDGKPVTQLSGHNLAILSVAFSPDGTRLIAGSYAWASHWDTKSWKKIAASVAHEREVHCLAFSPDGTQFATGGDDAKINVWDTQSNLIIKTLIGHAKPVHGIAFSPDGTRLVSGSRDRTLRLWDLRSGSELALPVPGKGQSVTFSHDGKLIASASNEGPQFASALNGSVYLWDARSGELRYSLKGHQNVVNQVSFSPDGERLASASHDRTVRIWDTKTGEEVAVLKGHAGGVLGVAFSPDGTRLATGSSDRTVKLWETASYQEISTLSGHQGGIYWIEFSPDGSQFATASNDRTAKLWDIRTATEIRTFGEHTGRLNMVAFDSDGQRLATAAYDGKVRVWDVASGKKVATANIRSGIAWGVDFSPDGKRIVTVGPLPTINLHDASGGQEIVSFQPSGGDPGVPCVNFNHDGTRVAIIGHDGYVRIYDAPRNHEATSLNGHTDTVDGVTFSADGSRIYSESANEKLVWDVVKRVIIPEAKWNPPETMAQTSPDGRWFATTESNNVVLVDLEYKNSPREKAYRVGKNRFDTRWHQEQAAATATSQNWYAATFHYAMLMQNDPDQSSYFDGLQSSFQGLRSLFEQQKRELEPHLATVVREALKLPPSNEAPNPGFEEPVVRAGRFEMRPELPGWKTTGTLFEIWSTGFMGVEAHDGKQFVELNAKEDATLYRDLWGIEQDSAIEFSFAHRGRNGDDTLRLTITDLGADNVIGGGDDTELFSKDFTTGKDAWAVYDSKPEPKIAALGNKLRFAFSAVHATGGRGPDNTEGNFLDSAEFGVGVVTAVR